MKSLNSHGQAGVRNLDTKADLTDWTEPNCDIPHTLRGMKAAEEAPSLGTSCYSRTLKVTWQIKMDGWNLCLVLACWGSLLQVQWRQMSTNAGWFGGRSVPSLKWTQARGLSGWTGWCPWALGWLELCVFRDEGEGWDGPPVFFISCTEPERWCMTGAFL